MITYISKNYRCYVWEEVVYLPSVLIHGSDTIT